MNEYRPAPAYAACAEVWVVTTYYNPAGYHTKRQLRAFCSADSRRRHPTGDHRMRIWRTSL